MTRRLAVAERTAQLVEAMHARRFVRLRRRFEDTRVRGYVMDVGPGFFVMALVSDRLWFDGFECFRLPDVIEVQDDPYVDFVEAALAKRGERLPDSARIDVSSIEAILTSAAAAFPLVSIHEEQVDPDVCWIGRVLEIRDGHLTMLEIGADAVWDDEPSTFALGNITRVGVGADYEDALHLVGGDPRVAEPA